MDDSKMRDNLGPPGAAGSRQQPFIRACRLLQLLLIIGDFFSSSEQAGVRVRL
jgi:hypothetical protein